MGLRRAGARDLGRPPRHPPRAGGRRLRAPAQGASRRKRARALGHLVPPRRPGRRRPLYRRAPPGDPAAARLGRRRPRRRARAGRRRSRPHRRGRRCARAEGGDGLYRLAHLAPRLLVAAQHSRHHRGRLPGNGRALDAHPRPLPGARRAVRARSPPLRDRLRRAELGARAGGAWRPPGLWHQLRPEPPRLPKRRLRPVHPRARRPHLPRPHERRLVVRPADARRPVRRTHRVWRPAPELGLPQPGARPDSVRRDHPRARRDRLRRAAVGGVGGRADGPRARRRRSRRLRAPRRLPAVGRGVRRAVRPRERRRPNAGQGDCQEICKRLHAAQYLLPISHLPRVSCQSLR